MSLDSKVKTKLYFFLFSFLPPPALLLAVCISADPVTLKWAAFDLDKD